MELDRSINPGSKDHLWLTEDELLTICEYFEIGSEQWFGVNLLARSGLKVIEMIEVEPDDVDVSDEPVLQVIGSGRRPVPHKAPLPSNVAYAILALDKDGPLVDRSERTVRRWCNEMGDDLARKCQNRNWETLSPRHIRNSWVDNLLRDGVPPITIMKWAGIQSYDRFQELYMSRIEKKLIKDGRDKANLF